MLRGVIHTHSTYSDGEYTLAELREVLLAAGCSFACMTDHAESFDGEKLTAYVAECESLSDERFRFVAGLEYECERRMHVLGYGVTTLAGTTDPQEVIRHIERAGGVSVIAHPMDSMFEWIEGFETLPRGIETWNTKYDGRPAPRPGTFRLLSRLRARRPDMHAFYGVDYHWKKQFRELYTLVECEGPPRRGEVLAALAAGRYVGAKGALRMPASGELPDRLLDEFGAANARAMRRRHIIKRVKKAADRLGLKVPAPVKAQLRRIF
jgi:hypothetical protein